MCVQLCMCESGICTIQTIVIIRCTYINEHPLQNKNKDNLFYSLWLTYHFISVRTSAGRRCAGSTEHRESKTRTIGSESIEWFKEDQAFLMSYVSAPIPVSRQQLVSLSQSFCVSPVDLTQEGGPRGGECDEGMGEEQNHKTARKPGPR